MHAVMATERLGIGPIARLRISWVAVMRADSDRPFMQTFIRVVKAAAAAASNGNGSRLQWRS